MLLKILLMLIVVAPFFVVLGAFVVRRLLYVGGPNEVLVFSGSRPKAIRGGYHVRIPLLQTVDRMDLSNMAVEVAVSNAYSKGGIPLTVQGVANLKIAGEQPMLGYAMQRFLGKSRKEIIAVAKETLEGNLRGVLSQLTPEEVNNDKLAFAEKLVEEAEHDLGRIGLVLDVLKIQNVSDDVDYLDSIGRKQTASLIQRARTAEAEAHAESVMRDAENRRRARLSELEADIQIAHATTEKRITDARTRREALIAEEVGQVKALIAKAEAELKVQQARIEQVRRRLEADVIAPAQANMEADQADARGKSAKIVEDGKATALVLEEMIATWQNGGENARDIFLMQKLQVVMDSLVSTIQSVHVDKMTVLPGSGGRAAQAVQLVEELKAGIGVDLPQLLEQFAGGRGAPQSVIPAKATPSTPKASPPKPKSLAAAPRAPATRQAVPVKELADRPETSWAEETRQANEAHRARIDAINRAAAQPRTSTRTIPHPTSRPRAGETVQPALTAETVPESRRLPEPPPASYDTAEQLRLAMDRS
jgi:flotillin